MDSYIPTQGLQPDKLDARDLLYEDVLGADFSSVDFDKGFHLFEELQLPILKEDQGRSYSCVGQATAQHLRAWRKKLFGEDIRFSSKFIYSQISLGMFAGASLRDGVKLVSTLGAPPEAFLHSYEMGVPPSEAFMYSRAELVPEIFKKALPFDTFTYRSIPGHTSNIDIFAHAIENNCGVVAGFTGTNPGWTRDMIRYPQGGEEKWGHAVMLVAYGMYQGKKCVFTPNSWGGRYTIQEGRWKGLQAIPVDYFNAAFETAVGPANGGYVFNGWVLVPDAKLSPQQRTMDFLKKNEGKLVQDVEQTGGFGIVIDGKIQVATPERYAALCLTLMMRQKLGVPTPKDLWNDAPKGTF